MNTTQVERTREWRKQNKLYLSEVKSASKCEVCGEARAVCLDFHHRDPYTKKFSLGEGKGWGIDAIKAEIKKCAVVCSNCHRVLHAEERLDKIKRIEDVEPMLWDHTEQTPNTSTEQNQNKDRTETEQE